MANWNVEQEGAEALSDGWQERDNDRECRKAYMAGYIDALADARTLAWATLGRDHAVTRKLREALDRAKEERRQTT